MLLDGHTLERIILCNLDCSSLWKARRVCKRWKTLAPEIIPTITMTNEDWELFLGGDNTSNRIKFIECAKIKHYPPLSLQKFVSQRDRKLVYSVMESLLMNPNIDLEGLSQWVYVYALSDEHIYDYDFILSLGDRLSPPNRQTIANLSRYDKNFLKFIHTLPQYRCDGVAHWIATISHSPVVSMGLEKMCERCAMKCPPLDCNAFRHLN